MPARSKTTSANSGTGVLRQLNRSLVLRTLWRRPGLSRSELARELGLAKSTVSVVVAELLEEELLHEGEEVPGGVGRPSRALELEGEKNLVLAWEISVDYLAVRLQNLMGEVRCGQDLELGLGPDPEACLDRLAQASKELLRGLGHNVYLRGLCLSVPGLVEPRPGHLTLAPNLGWQDLPLLEMLEHKLIQHKIRVETPPILENEANAAALGVYTLGEWRVANLAYLSLGIGLGSGLVLDRQLFWGSHGHAGEIGHVPLDPQGPPCRCGKRGCAETFVSLKAWRADPTEAGLERMADKLGLLLAQLLNLLDPDVVVLGGPLVEEVGPRLLPLARAAARRYALEQPARTAQIALSPFGRDSAILGAGVLAIRAFLEAQRSGVDI
ncbi:ROK family transcriptional regulator [Calidithermus timidus]|jgi:predicted NBD/HSP70 family sugar kinase|uniref:ROK family transcriptional regulator n=1 Tax=Calidithermus timidus TaxID=307124 RepID=UPI000364F399|nr:ROK family transcriptional regulator [Calidithermus timidus]